VNEEDLADLFGGGSPFSDFFETYFGGGLGAAGRGRTRTTGFGQRGAYAPAGQDVEAEVSVPLADAYRGATRTFDLAEPGGSTRRLEVKIPAGVDEGARIRLAGQGMSGQGDLYLRVHIVPDARFKREGAHLHTRVDVPLAIAVLGGEVLVPMPDGRRLLLQIPPGTANGRIFRLRGQGMSIPGQPGTRGDLYVEANVALPTHLTEEQRRLFEAFARSTGYTGQPTRVEGRSSP
jgi:curved DNA-binding protein